MDKQKESFFKDLSIYLKNTLGPDYEIIVHSIKNGDYENARVIALENGYISGRNLNSPLTDLALKMIKDKEYEKSNYKTHYIASTKNNKKIIGSTFFIKNDVNELEGLLCINHDISKIDNAVNNLLNVLNISNLQNMITESPSSESLSESIEDIIYSVVDPTLLNSNMLLSPEQKQVIIKKLYHKGVFSMKGAVAKVAKIIKTSEPTIYRYLKEVK
ncbi:PAS domain-containing protein [Lactobacillus mulieris]|uniref:helix-turn-helix transcriptional regulator n=1 Tax=Lactobacillus mulieris TaxID=2508708 RepID=UPI001432C66C|nr:PAS domain-containing protein [Lactobacillus mulieris]MCF1783273.1 PAS domain-containing protein [Lactobacillus mulieris]MCW8104023.1 PAS domain-containing protein [Lactobacillus mulieris]MDK6803933.1 PAS domain-containing protein [Lactobacillus mulieris]MDK8383085.1 PAS domain-containing protein [Lactobacillus mulieris]MDT9621271.1 PAS domain-containing protein [Lactobacillus mulieris]